MLPPGRNKVEGRILPVGLMFATCDLDSLVLPRRSPKPPSLSWKGWRAWPNLQSELPFSHLWSGTSGPDGLRINVKANNFIREWKQ